MINRGHAPSPDPDACAGPGPEQLIIHSPDDSREYSVWSRPQSLRRSASLVEDGKSEESAQPALVSESATPWHKRLEKFMLMLSLGISSRERISQITEPTAHEEWRRFKENIFTRVTNVNVVASLVLAIAAAFLTTTPSTSMVNWLHPMPYITLLAAFCLGFCSIGSGVFLLLTLMDLRPESLRKISVENGKFGLGLVLLALPTLFLGASGASGIVALCGAVYFGDSTIAKVGLFSTCGVTTLIITGFFLTVY